MRFVVSFILAYACQLAHAAPPEPMPTDLSSPAVSPPGLTPEVAATPAAEPDVKSYWYQALGVDALALTLVAVAADANANNSETLTKLSIGTYLLGAPL